jgi:hypothetical protein
MVGGVRMNIIKFADFGETLGTRKLGESIRNEVETQIRLGNKTIFDFNGVDLISNSFADECFGKLVEHFGMEIIKSKTTFANTNSKVSMVVKKAVTDRLNRMCCV